MKLVGAILWHFMQLCIIIQHCRLCLYLENIFFSSSFLVCIFEGITFKNIYDTVKFAMPFTLLYPENFIYFYLAAYSFEGIIVFSLLVICTCAYMRRVPRLKQWFLSEKKGFFGVFYKGEHGIEESQVRGTTHIILQTLFSSLQQISVHTIHVQTKPLKF